MDQADGRTTTPSASAEVSWVEVPRTTDYGGGHLLRWTDLHLVRKGQVIARIDRDPEEGSKMHVDLNDEHWHKFRDLAAAKSFAEAEVAAR